MDSVKTFIKENLLLSILFVVVVGAFLGNIIYKGIRDAIDNNTPYEPEVKEVYYQNRNYEVNEYKVVTKDDQDLAEFYYDKLRKMLMNDPGAIYDKMTKKCQEYYDSRDAFINYIVKFKSSTTATSVVEYYKVNGSSITIMSSDNIEFKLEQDGINDYKITLVAKIS